ncbi:hypothetical protein HDU86_002578 [Geranomyces michiganensis]|nr:hypothetical protein HDU86_002578 [Geranomyces michiganensis]
MFVLNLAANDAADDADLAEQSLLEKRSDAMKCLMEAAKEERLHRLHAFQTVNLSLDPLVQVQDEIAFRKQENLRLLEVKDKCEAFLAEHVPDVMNIALTVTKATSKHALQLFTWDFILLFSLDQAFQ